MGDLRLLSGTHTLAQPGGRKRAGTADVSTGVGDAAALVSRWDANRVHGRTGRQGLEDLSDNSTRRGQSRNDSGRRG